MPVYEYACKSCGHHLEVSQSFTDDPLTTCPVCGGPLRKVFSPIGIVLKGSGFYRTDSRTPSPKPKSERTGDKGAEKTGDKTAGDKTSGDKTSGDRTSGDRTSTGTGSSEKAAKSDSGAANKSGGSSTAAKSA